MLNKIYPLNDFRSLFVVSIAIIALFWPSLIHSQPIPDSLLEYELPEQVNAQPGEAFETTITLTIHEQWHINSNPASMEFLIPTKIESVSTGAVRLENVSYPDGESFQFEFVPRPISVYQNSVDLNMQFRVRSDYSGGAVKHPLKLTYQACDDRRCLSPKTLPIDLLVNVSGSSGNSVDSQQTPTRTGNWPSLMSITGTSDPDVLQGVFSGQGIFVGLIVVFILGLSLNLTPCVYPMVPITVGYFGSGQTDSFSRRLVDAVFFVLGMAIIYSILGALAGMGGQILGDTLQSPWVQAGLAGLMVVLSGTMFGFYQFRLPATIQKESESLGKALGTFGMGMTLGIVAAPCLAPATVALLGYIGQTQNPLAGAGLFFVLSLGLGLPYVFLALFSSQLNQLPGSGEWLEWVEKLLGFVILAVAVYFLWPMLSNRQFGYAMIGLIVLATVTLITTHRPSSLLRFTLRGTVVLGISITLLMVISQTFILADTGIQWEVGDTYIRETTGQSVQQTTVVYLSADWCVPCKEMEVSTFRDSRVQNLMNRTRAVKIDLSNPPPVHVQRWLNSRRVMGVPTIFFFTPREGLRSDLTIMGYTSAGNLIKSLQAVLKE